MLIAYFLYSISQFLNITATKKIVYLSTQHLELVSRNESRAAAQGQCGDGKLGVKERVLDCTHWCSPGSVPRFWTQAIMRWLVSEALDG